MRTEFLQLFVQSKTGWLGRDLKKHAAGFAEINGIKIRAINYWRHVVAKIDEMFAPLELFGLVLRAKRNMMHRTRSDSPHRCVRQTKQIDDSAWCSVIRRHKAKSVSRLLDQTKTETVGEQSRRPFVTFQ